MKNILRKLCLVICVILFTVINVPAAADTGEETKQRDNSSEETSEPDSSEEKELEVVSEETGEVTQAVKTPQTKAPGPIPSDAVTVNNWAELIFNIREPSVSYIVLGDNIVKSGSTSATTNDPGSISRSLTIDGNGYSINFGNGSTDGACVLLDTVSTATDLTVKNISLTKVDDLIHMFYTTDGENWNITVEDVKCNPGITGNSAGLINAPKASLTVLGQNNDFNFRRDSYSMIHVGSISVSAGAVVNATTNYYPGCFFEAANDFLLGDGAVMTTDSTTTDEDPNYHAFKIGGSMTMNPTSKITINAVDSPAINVGVDLLLDEGSALMCNSTMPAASTANQVTVAGNLTVSAGAEVSGESVGKSLFQIGGDLVNEGKMTCKSTTTSASAAYVMTVVGNLTLGEQAELVGDAGGKSLFQINKDVLMAKDSKLFVATNTSNTGYDTYYQMAVGGNFTMGEHTEVTSTSGNKSSFQVTGEFLVGQDSKLSLTSTTNEGTAGTGVYHVEVGGNFTIQEGTAVTVNSVGKSFFRVTGDFTIETESNLSCVSTSTSGAGNANVFGINVDGNITINQNATVTAESASKSLFRTPGDFTVGIGSTINAKSTQGAYVQFDVKNFVAMTRSTVRTESSGATYQFIINGDFKMRSGGRVNTGAAWTANSTGASNSILYMLGGGAIEFASFTKATITNNGTRTGLDDANVTSGGDLSHGIYGQIGALTLQAHSEVAIHAANTAFRSSYNITVGLYAGAVLDAYAESQGTFVICEDYADKADINPIITVSGAGTKLNLNCNSNEDGYYGAAMRVLGKDIRINVVDSGEINAVAQHGTVLQIQGIGTQFNVNTKGKMNVTQVAYGGVSLSAAIRFRWTGSQKFIIDDGEVNVTSAAMTPAIRLYGGGNEIRVTGGGSLNVHNKGDGTASNGGDTGRQGILYTGAGDAGDLPDLFYLSGEKSTVSVIADYGSAIQTDGGSTITVENQSNFIVSGRTASEDVGTIACDGKIDIKLNNPMYFDMRNNHPTGNVMSAGEADSTFESTQSDLSVWNKGTDLEGNPTKSWYLIDYSLAGEHFEKFVSSSMGDDFKDDYGDQGAQQYSRMSANNSAATIENLRVPTDADKHIYGYATVPEGVDGIRDAWTNEVHVTVNVYDKDDNLIYEELPGDSIGAASDGSDEGISVYGEPEKAGILVIDVEGDNYLEAGMRVEVVKAWRGEKTFGTTPPHYHQSTADEIKATAVVTQDVTPPDPLKATDIDSSVRMFGGDLTTRTTGISGTSDQKPGTSVYLYRNNNKEAQTTIAADGTWSFTFATTLAETDKIAVALNDNIPNSTALTSYDLDKLGDNGIYANSGNENPPSAYTFHDATFAGRLSFGVVFYGALELTVSPDEVSYGTHGIAPGVTRYKAESIEVGVEDSRKVKEQWLLTAQLTKEFTLVGDDDVLDVDLVYAYGGVETEISTTGANIWTHKNLDDTIFDIDDQWEIGDSVNNGLFVKANAGDIKTGSYTAEVTWTLSDVP